VGIVMKYPVTIKEVHSIIIGLTWTNDLS
jgi:hypothetical protein